MHHPLLTAFLADPFCISSYVWFWSFTFKSFVLCPVAHPFHPHFWMLIFSELSLSHTQVSLTKVDSCMMICLLRSHQSVAWNVIVSAFSILSMFGSWAFVTHNLSALVESSPCGVLIRHYLLILSPLCFIFSADRLHECKPRECRAWSLATAVLVSPSSFIWISTGFNFLLLLQLHLLSVF